MLIQKVFYIDNYHLEHFAPIFVRGQSGPEGAV